MGIKLLLGVKRTGRFFKFAVGVSSSFCLGEGSLELGPRAEKGLADWRGAWGLKGAPWQDPTALLLVGQSRVA